MKASIEAKLYDQWIDWIKNKLDELFGEENVAHYSNPHDYAIDWFSWNRRVLSATPRKIEKSTAFQCPDSRLNGLKQLEQAIASGKLLSPWLSKTIRNVSYEDAMLNDWGIHHLHLGEKISADGFIERTGELLFAIFTDITCYEIGVFKHGDWSEIDLLEIVNQNWPELLESRKLKGIIDISHNPTTKEEITALRKAHVCYMLKLSDGSIIMPPGGGVMTDGTASDAVLAADWWGRLFRNAESKIIEIIQENIRKGQLPDDGYNFKLFIDDTRIYALDTRHDIKFKIWEKNA